MSHRGSVSSDSGLGGWIRSTRLDRGVSQRELAKRAGVSQSYLCDIELERGAQPSLAIVDRIASALDTSRTELLEAAGVVEGRTGGKASEHERRFYVVFRNLNDENQQAVERFAKFLLAEEQRWVQPKLLESGTPNLAAEPDGPLFDK